MNPVHIICFQSINNNQAYIVCSCTAGMETNTCLMAIGYQIISSWACLAYSVCEVGTVGLISDCQPEGPRFNPQPGQGLNFGQPSFAALAMDRDVKPLV